jgi:hypothetical protein
VVCDVGLTRHIWPSGNGSDGAGGAPRRRRSSFSFFQRDGATWERKSTNSGLRIILTGFTFGVVVLTVAGVVSKGSGVAQVALTLNPMSNVGCVLHGVAYPDEDDGIGFSFYIHRLMLEAIWPFLIFTAVIHRWGFAAVVCFCFLTCTNFLPALLSFVRRVLNPKRKKKKLDITISLQRRYGTQKIRAFKANVLAHGISIFVFQLFVAIDPFGCVLEETALRVDHTCMPRTAAAYGLNWTCHILFLVDVAVIQIGHATLQGE